MNRIINKKTISILLAVVLSLALFIPFAANNSGKTEAAIKDSELQTVLETMMGDSFDGYDTKIEVKNGNVFFRVSIGQTESTIESGKKSQTVLDAWKTLRESFVNLSEVGQESLISLELPNAAFTILVVDEVNTKDANVYLCVVNGVVAIDFYADYI